MELIDVVSNYYRKKHIVYRADN